MKFQQLALPDGSIDPATILFTDENGTVWTVPDGHRFWAIYQKWLSEGNKPLAA